jgi:hypothetical protein
MDSQIPLPPTPIVLLLTRTSSGPVLEVIENRSNLSPQEVRTVSDLLVRYALELRGTVDLPPPTPSDLSSLPPPVPVPASTVLYNTSQGITMIPLRSTGPVSDLLLCARLTACATLITLARGGIKPEGQDAYVRLVEAELKKLQSIAIHTDPDE